MTRGGLLLLCGLALGLIAAEPAGEALGVIAAEPAGEAAALRHVDRVPAGPSLDARLVAIQRLVQAAARYPENARMRGVSGVARVAFEVRPDGTPVSIAVVESSGSIALDRAAARAVHGAGALPRVIGRVHVPVRFTLVGSY